MFPPCKINGKKSIDLCGKTTLLQLILWLSVKPLKHSNPGVFFQPSYTIKIYYKKLKSEKRLFLLKLFMFFRPFKYMTNENENIPVFFIFLEKILKRWKKPRLSIFGNSGFRTGFGGRRRFGRPAPTWRTVFLSIFVGSGETAAIKAKPFYKVSSRYFRVSSRLFVWAAAQISTYFDKRR